MADPLANIDADFAARLQQLIAAAPGRIELRGGGHGFRSRSDQARLYRQKPHLAAPPGRSNHEKGLAYDLVFEGGMAGPVAVWAHANAARFGLKFPMLGGKGKKYEPWHIELSKAPERAYNKTASPSAPSTTAAPQPVPAVPVVPAGPQPGQSDPHTFEYQITNLLDLLKQGADA